MLLPNLLTYNYAFFYFPKMSRTVKRSLQVVIPEKTTKRHKSTKTKKQTNSMLLSGHTNVNNKKMIWTGINRSMNITATTMGHLLLRANSPYDPDWSYGGVSAYGFKTMTDRYNRYYVKDATFKLLGARYGASAGATQTYALVWADNSDVFDASTDVCTAAGRCKSNGGKIVRLSANPELKTPLVSLRVKTKDLWRNGIKDDGNIGTSSTNPANNIFFHVVCFHVADATTTNAVDLAMTIEYNTMWLDPQDSF